jgi:hypothetical protein
MRGGSNYFLNASDILDAETQEDVHKLIKCVGLAGSEDKEEIAYS